MLCERCNKEPAQFYDGFCWMCHADFIKLKEQLRLAFIHSYGHPDKKTLWVHLEESE